jgi:hypothetical protein
VALSVSASGFYWMYRRSGVMPVGKTVKLKARGGADAEIPNIMRLAR